MKILLLSAPYLKEYMRNARCDFVSLSSTQWYPLLLGYCGAYLEGKGHGVKLMDCPTLGLSHDEARAEIRRYGPDLIVLYTGRLSETNDIEFAEPLVEELRCDAVIVGPFASANPSRALSRSKVIGKLVLGEFERPVEELAAGRRPEEINNLVYKNGAAVVKNPLRPYMTGKELDDIPFVSKFFSRHVDIFKYRTLSEYYPFMDILTGRGCQWGLCTYCLWVHTYIKGKTYNLRSVENVLEEFRFIEKELPKVRSVMIQDDTFTDERAAEFCEKKIKSGVKLPFSCYSRANMKKETLELLKKAGCRNLHVGYESGDNEVLKTIKKGLTVEMMTKFTEDAKKSGLRIHGDFAFGFPGETPEKAAKTIDWACSIRPHTAQFQLMIPFEGTPFYEQMASSGWLNEKGQPDMPQFTNAQIQAAAKTAYRRFYLSPQYLLQALRHPYEYVFSRPKTIKSGIAAIFWRKWSV